MEKSAIDTRVLVAWEDAENYAATVGKRQAWCDFMFSSVHLDFERATAICNDYDFDVTLLDKSYNLVCTFEEVLKDRENNTAAPA